MTPLLLLTAKLAPKAPDSASKVTESARAGISPGHINRRSAARIGGLNQPERALFGPKAIDPAERPKRFLASLN